MFEPSSPVMSTTSTPAASPNKAMDLTPRSKIRALLASVDDDSEKENGTVAPVVQKEKNVLAQSPPRNARTSAESDEDTDEDVVRPRARKNTVVARLLAEGTGAVSSDEEPTADGNAYDRIRQQLMAPKAPETVIPHHKESIASSDSDATPVQRKSMKRKRLERLSSPASSRIPATHSSPGLFVSSPEKSRTSPQADDRSSESDALADLSKMSRLQALVAKKREERLAKEKALEEAREAASSSPATGKSSAKKKTPRTSKAIQVESETDDDREVADKLTSSARPTRKASKRAMEEMHRETQRMSRNMQLAHEAKTKTKFTTEALFKKFGFRQDAASVPVQFEQGISVTSSVPGTSDSEKLQEAGTPPSSPPMMGEEVIKTTAANVMMSSPLPAIPDGDNEDVELPDIHSALSQVAEERLKSSSAAHVPVPQHISAKKFGKSVKRPTPLVDDDDDDGLEIVDNDKPSHPDIFDLIKPAKSRPSGNLHVVRALAQVETAHAHGKKAKPSMTTGELHFALQQRARQQAQRVREEKIQRLREKGIYVQTAEEKEKEQLQVEDMLEKARREAGELAKREKEAAKKEGKEVTGAMPDSDDEDDEDWDGEEEEGEGDDDAEADLELSGSEDEEEEADEDEEEDRDMAKDATNALIDEEAEDSSDVEEDRDSAGERLERNDYDLPVTTKRPRKKIVDSDDEDEDSTPVLPLIEAITPVRTVAQASAPKSGLADAFGFAPPKAVTSGLSQMFAGTMAESQTSLQGDTQAFDTQEDSLAFLRGLAQPDLPMPDFSATIADDSQDIVIPNSQAEQSQDQGMMSPAGLFRFETQTQMPYIESQEMSQIPEPTQDVGFQHFSTPVKTVPFQASFATVDTVALSPRPAQKAALSEDDEEDLVQRKKGRLVRREQRASLGAEDQVVSVDAEEQGEEDEAMNNEPTQNAFLIMRKAATKPNGPTFDKKRSEAKGMIEEQAEESEDEYAGLGGASDSEDGEYDEETRKMIDDDSNEKLNERAVAKFHADKERADDEKRVERLFKDIANGGLRRKRGAEMELWESDDEDEAMARRRAAKQREFAKMRKALLADEKLGKIAENPKQQAFLAAIEDHDEDDTFDLLDVVEESQPTFSQVADNSQSQGQTQPSINTTTRPIGESNDAGSSTARLPANLRRTARSSRPTSILEIRNTLSELIGEDSLVEATAEDEAYGDEELQHQDSMDIDIDLEHDDDDDDDDDGEELAEGPSELMPPPPAPVAAIPPRASAIDRRRSRPQNATMPANQTTLAFAPVSATLPTFFRKPSLLRRATTASSTEGNSNTTAARGGLGLDKSIRQGGTSKSSINYHVREKEKMAKVERVDRERREAKERVGKMRRRELVKGDGKGKGKLGGLVGGGWD